MGKGLLQEKPLEITTALQKTDKDEVDKDQLNLLPYARALKTFIEDCPTPMTIGIQGDWGTGKTSLLNMLRGDDTNTKSGLLTSTRCLVVNFETWSYSMFNERKSLPTACLYALTEKLGATLRREGLLKEEKGKAAFEKASSRLMNVIKNVNVGVPGISIPVGKALEGEETAPRADDLSQEMIHFKKNFQELALVWADDAKKRVVICVDDLDRVQPVIALEMLEAIKNFLDVEGCVFILAVDFEVIQAGMKEKLGVDVQKTSGKSFFDKIIQLPFNMPKDSYDLKAYLGKLITETNLPYAEKMDKDYLCEITSSSVGSNPRSIKRIMNYARLINLIRDENKSREESFSTRDSEVLYAIICMQIAWPELFSLFLSDPTCDMIANMENWEYLDRTPQLKPLFERVPDEERLKNNISTFFDTLFGKLDEDGDGQITDKEFQSVMKVMKMAQFTSVDVKPRPRDQLIELIKTNSKDNQEIVSFLENVYQNSSVYLNSKFVYRPAGTRYVTLAYKRKQLGSVVTLRENPIVIRLNVNPETLKSYVKNISSNSSPEDLENIIVGLDAVVRGTGGEESALTGFGDTIINTKYLMRIEPSEAIRLLNLVIDATSALLFDVTP
jgi:hypothetical protein